MRRIALGQDGRRPLRGVTSAFRRMDRGVLPARSLNAAKTERLLSSLSRCLPLGIADDISRQSARTPQENPRGIPQRIAEYSGSWALWHLVPAPSGRVNPVSLDRSCRARSARTALIGGTRRIHWGDYWGDLLHSALGISGCFSLIQADRKMVDLSTKRWSGRRDSNSRPFDPQSNALTRLRYVPTLENDSLALIGLHTSRGAR